VLLVGAQGDRSIQLRYLLKVESWMLDVFQAVQHGQGASVKSNAQRPTLNAEHPTTEGW
jgi:hypothetical protein